MSAVGTTRLNAVRAYRFETKALLVTVATEEGYPVSLSDAAVFFTAKSLSTETTVITKSLSDGIEVVNAAKGTARITLSTSDTDLPSGQYRYDIWVEFDSASATPRRYPVVRYAELLIEDSVHTFGG